MTITGKSSSTLFLRDWIRGDYPYSYITFRMDDICPKMDYEKFLLFREIFCKYNVKPLLGVVPDNRDENLNRGEEILDFWMIIQQLRNAGWSIAQHGHTHVYTTTETGRFSLCEDSEFAGLPYAVQLQKIRLGRELLNSHGIETDIFMAPSHSLDENTLKALVDCSFHYITDGRSKRPYIYRDLTFIPCRHHQFKNKTGLVTICIHPNTASDKTFLALEAFIRQNREKIIDFSHTLSLPTMNYAQARIEERINIIFLKYIKPLLYPLYSRIKYGKFSEGK
jgi:Predicted deacetylase